MIGVGRPLVHEESGMIAATRREMVPATRSAYLTTAMY